MTNEKLIAVLRNMLCEGERKGYVHKMATWPSSPVEQDAIRRLWRKRDCVIIEPFEKSFWEDTERWAVHMDYWDKMKRIGEHLSFVSTGIMCGASLWSTGQK